MTHSLRALLSAGAAAPRRACGWLALSCCVASCRQPTTGGVTPVPERAMATRREIARTEGGAGIVEYHPTANTAWVVDVRGRPDSLWPRVMVAYRQLGLPVGEIDTQAHTLGTSSMRVTGRLGGTRLSEYLDCGAGPLGTASADTYVVTLRATTGLTPGSEQMAPFTTIRTLLSATAKPNTTQGDPVECVSTGRLETRLARLIAADTSKPSAR